MIDTILVTLWFSMLFIGIPWLAIGNNGMIAIAFFLKRVLVFTCKLCFWLFVVAIVINLFSSGSEKVKTISNPESGSCDKGGVYSKHFNCDYIYNKATYKVLYWRYLNSDNSERYVDTVVSLNACRDTAIYEHRDVNDRMNQDLEWSEGMYVCMLTKDGRNLEKHRVF